MSKLRPTLPFLLVLTAVAILYSPYAIAQEPTEFTGRVINLSADGQSPVGLEVILHVFTPSGGVDTRTAVTDADGAFAFANVPTGPEVRYALTATYRDITYGVEPENLQAPVVLGVYETTNDLAALNIDSHILIVRGADPKENLVSAAEVVLISNVKDRAFQPILQPASAMNFLRFTVPPGTSGLQVQSDLPSGDIMDVGTGFGLTAAVPPGSHQVSFNYTFPYEGGSASFSPTFLQGASIFRILIPEGLGEASGAGLTEAQQTSIGDETYRVWSVPNLTSRASLSIELTGLPQPSLWQRSANAVEENHLLVIGIPALVTAALCVILLYSLRRRSKPVPATSNANPQGLIDEIARLDNLREDGRLDESEYRQRREGLKQRLRSTIEYEEPPP